MCLTCANLRAPTGALGNMWRGWCSITNLTWAYHMYSPTPLVYFVHFILAWDGAPLQLRGPVQEPLNILQTRHLEVEFHLAIYLLWPLGG